MPRNLSRIWVVPKPTIRTWWCGTSGGPVWTQGTVKGDVSSLGVLYLLSRTTDDFQMWLVTAVHALAERVAAGEIPPGRKFRSQWPLLPHPAFDRPLNSRPRTTGMPGSQNPHYTKVVLRPALVIVGGTR